MYSIKLLSIFLLYGSIFGQAEDMAKRIHAEVLPVCNRCTELKEGYQTALVSLTKPQLRRLANIIMGSDIENFETLDNEPFPLMEIENDEDKVTTVYAKLSVKQEKKICSMVSHSEDLIKMGDDARHALITRSFNKMLSRELKKIPDNIYISFDKKHSRYTLYIAMASSVITAILSSLLFKKVVIPRSLGMNKVKAQIVEHQGKVRALRQEEKHIKDWISSHSES